jgi:hypothetical protein
MGLAGSCAAGPVKARGYLLCQASGGYVLCFATMNRRRSRSGAVHPSGRRLATKVRVFIAFLARILAEEPSLAFRTTA